MKTLIVRKIAAALTCLCLLCGLLAVWPAATVRAAAPVIINISSLDAPGNGWVLDGSIVKINTPGSYTITGSSSQHTIAVVTAGTYDITLSNATITPSAESVVPLDLQRGQVTLHIVGTSKLTGKLNAAALRVAGGASGASLTIAGSGVLEAVSNGLGAAIGGGSDSRIGVDSVGGTGGKLTITGGTVTAVSLYGAAIGGGGAGSSSGTGGAGGKLIVTGGVVTATSKSTGAAIGGGGTGGTDVNGGGQGADVHISGGTVTAISNRLGAAIGGGGGLSYVPGGAGGSVTITGAATRVVAIAGNTKDAEAAQSVAIGGAKTTQEGQLRVDGGAVLELWRALPDAKYLQLSPGQPVLGKGFLYEGLVDGELTLKAGKQFEASLSLTGGTATARASFDNADSSDFFTSHPLLIPQGAKTMSVALTDLPAHHVIATATATGATATHTGSTITVSGQGPGGVINSDIALAVTLRDDSPAPEPVAASGLSLNMGAKLLKRGQRVTLKATVRPANAADKTVVWASSNKKVATVTANGVVRAKKNGKATITAKAGGKTVRCQIVVRADAPQRAMKAVKLHKRTASIRLGKTLALKATLRPAKPFNKRLVWASSDPSIATVNAKGVVRAKAKGRVKITATSFEGGKIATCTVTVK